jgi:hypothetical protein
MDMMFEVFCATLVCALVGMPASAQLSWYLRERWEVSLWPRKAYLVTCMVVAFSVPSVATLLFRDWNGCFPIVTFGVYIAFIFTSLGANMARMRSSHALTATAVYAVDLTTLFMAGFLFMLLLPKIPHVLNVAPIQYLNFQCKQQDVYSDP